MGGSASNYLDRRGRELDALGRRRRGARVISRVSARKGSRVGGWAAYLYSSLPGRAAISAVHVASEGGFHALAPALAVSAVDPI